MTRILSYDRQPIRAEDCPLCGCVTVTLAGFGRSHVTRAQQEHCDVASGLFDPITAAAYYRPIRPRDAVSPELRAQWQRDRRTTTKKE